MEKNKAIQLLERLQDPEPYEPKLTKDAYDAIQMAIDALSADGDTISRQAAIDALTKDKKALKHIINEMSGYEKEFERLLYQRNQVDYDIDAIKQLPPAQPEPKRGRWIYKTDLVTAPTGYWECSECKEGRLLYEENFCPHCGADMRER